MKNKKLFAILTLVCFMFTLMPVAAFAAVDYSDYYVEVHGTTNDTTFDDSIVVEVDEVVTYQVLNGADAVVAGMGIFAVNEDDELEAVTTAGSIAFDAEGTYKVYGLTAADADRINGLTITKADKLDLLMEVDSLIEDAATVKVKASDLEYQIVLRGDVVAGGNPEDGYVINIANNGGWDKDGEITATLQKINAIDPAWDAAGWSDVKSGEELTFTTAGYVDIVTENGAETDRGGDVEFEVVSERAGKYTVYVKYGSVAKTKLTVNVTAETVANVEVVNAPKAPIDIDQDAQKADIEFKFTDAAGRAFDNFTMETVAGKSVITEGDVRIAVIDKPADSDVDKDSFNLYQEALRLGDGEDDAKGVYTLVGAFDEEGEYTIKVTLKNGDSASVTVNVAEQGEIVGIKYDVYNTPRTVVYGEAAAFNALLAYDANGVTSNVSADATFSANAPAVLDVAGSALIIKNDDDYIGDAITVYAVYEDFTASTVVTVTDQPTTITYADATAEVGVNAEIAGVVVDTAGNRTSIAGNGVTSGTALILSKPADAIAVADVDVDGKGNVVLNFLGSAEGEYEVLTTISYVDATSLKKVFVSGTATIVVGEGEGTFEDVIVMSIGAKQLVKNSEVIAMPAAPEIVDSRTMVPARAGLEAFGATVVWDEATQTVTAELDGVKVVMEIGEKAYTVNGKAVVGDAAPYITAASTMVPVSFFTNAFGITATPIYDDYGVCDVMFTK